LDFKTRAFFGQKRNNDMIKKTVLNAITAILLVISSSCLNNESNSKTEKHDKAVLTENFDWLIGKWERTNEEEGKNTFENWRKLNELEYKGFGWTIQNSDTIFQEKIRLNKSNDGWVFGVIAPEETDYTIFTVMQIHKESFTCENPEIDFPSKIKYWKDGNEIKARVTGMDMEITFEFKKTKPEYNY